MSEEFLQNHQLDSFLLSKRRDDDNNNRGDDHDIEEVKAGEESNSKKNTPQQFKYMIFVWNGKKADAMVKATAISKGYELDSLLAQAKDPVLQVFFAGGVIRGKKLHRSNILTFDENITDTKRQEGSGLETVHDNPNTPSA
jgi:hypothetical protein